MFHHLPEELNRAVTLVSHSTFSSGGSHFYLLTSFAKTGCAVKGNKRREKSMPPLEFGYSECPPVSDAVMREVEADNLCNVHAAEGIHYQLVDLEGHRQPRLFYEQSGDGFTKEIPVPATPSLLTVRLS
jgi:hypothetical protein